jgi:transcriptional regulator with XRE-family HTH domain
MAENVGSTMKVLLKQIKIIDHVATGKQFRKERERRALRMKEIAILMGKSQQYISDLEYGRTNWREDLAVDYTNALDGIATLPASSSESPRVLR